MLKIAELLFHVINILVSGYLVYMLFTFAKSKKVKSLSHSFYLLCLVFVLFICLEIIEIAQILPENFEWGLLKQITYLIFLLSTTYVLFKMKETMIAHEHLIKDMISK